MKSLRRSPLLAALLAATALSPLAHAQQVGEYGIVISGTPSGTTPSQGDVDISGAFKVNGTPVAQNNTTTGLFVTPVSTTAMRTAAGLMMTGSASGTNFGLTYTPGTGTYLVGTATSSGSTSDVTAFDVVLPPNYVAGTNITVKAACYYTTSSGTASVETMTLAAYLNNVTAGTQGSNVVTTAAQSCPVTTAAQQTFTIPGTGLVPGSYLTLTLTANVTNSSGASTEYLTGVTYQ